MIENVPSFTENDYGSEKLEKDYMFTNYIEPGQPDEVTNAFNNA